MPPMEATVAGLEPEMAPKKAEETTVMMPSPPGIEPMRVLAKFTSRLEMPPPSIRPPASMKKGMAMNGKESTDVNMRCTTTSGGTAMGPKTRAIIEAKPKATAMGILNSINIRNEPNSSTPNLYPS